VRLEWDTEKPTPSGTCPKGQDKERDHLPERQHEWRPIGAKPTEHDLERLGQQREDHKQPCYSEHRNARPSANTFDILLLLLAPEHGGDQQHGQHTEDKPRANGECHTIYRIEKERAEAASVECAAPSVKDVIREPHTVSGGHSEAHITEHAPRLFKLANRPRALPPKTNAMAAKM
jgi:hypothetical protein